MNVWLNKDYARSKLDTIQFSEGRSRREENCLFRVNLAPNVSTVVAVIVNCLTHFSRAFLLYNISAD
jgi:hypothetical protein